MIKIIIPVIIIVVTIIIASSVNKSDTIIESFTNSQQFQLVSSGRHLDCDSYLVWYANFESGQTQKIKENREGNIHAFIEESDFNQLRLEYNNNRINGLELQLQLECGGNLISDAITQVSGVLDLKIENDASGNTNTYILGDRIGGRQSFHDPSFISIQLRQTELQEDTRITIFTLNLPNSVLESQLGSNVQTIAINADAHVEYEFSILTNTGLIEGQYNTRDYQNSLLRSHINSGLTRILEETLPSDTDGDGISDQTDRCPLEPETYNGLSDSDGCPDVATCVGSCNNPDSDKDGIPDISDACPTQPENYNNFDDRDGCPDIRNDNDFDNDNIPNDIDACPTLKETINGYRDSDGCPDMRMITTQSDSDGDGIFDNVDLCPAQAENKNGINDGDGCPDTFESVQFIPTEVKDTCIGTICIQGIENNEILQQYNISIIHIIIISVAIIILAVFIIMRFK